MRLLVSLDHIYTGTPDGAVWTGAMHDHAYWQRYLDVFDEVVVAARVVPAAQPGNLRADGPGVRFCALPMYQGAVGFLRHRGEIARCLDALLVPGTAVSVRVPSQLGYLLASRTRRRGLPLAAEVVADPWTYFTAGVTRHPLRPLLRRISAARLRATCRAARTLCYVTGAALQRAYPPGPGATVESVLDIDLDDAWFAPPMPSPAPVEPTLVLVGNFPSLYKGQDLLIRALPELARLGTPCRLDLVGEGREEGNLRALAAGLGVSERVHFGGSAAGPAAVRARLDAATVFVLPSRSEGLPRSLVEAMARGLPCIATDVGGMPELLPAADLVAVDDLPGLIASLARVLADPALRTDMGQRNRERALPFHRERIAERRLRFLRAVRAAAGG